jgi:hypothetical protein
MRAVQPSMQRDNEPPTRPRVNTVELNGPPHPTSGSPPASTVQHIHLRTAEGGVRSNSSAPEPQSSTINPHSAAIVRPAENADEQPTPGGLLAAPPSSPLTAASGSSRLSQSKSVQRPPAPSASGSSAAPIAGSASGGNSVLQAAVDEADREDSKSRSGAADAVAPVSPRHITSRRTAKYL